eukprot:symbB.v1.2.000496.t3/scaffold11.1/size528188/45
MGRTQLKRQVMHTMDQLSNRVYDLAFNAWSVSTANPILGPGAHSMNAELMQQVRPQTVELLGQMEDLLNILEQAIEDGQLTPEEGKGVEALLDKMRNLEKELATNFHQHRRSITLNQASRMYEDVRVAQVLHWSISRIVGEIVEVAEGVVKFSQDKDALPPSPETGGMMTMFEGLADKDHVLYAWRGISSIIHSRIALVAVVFGMWSDAFRMEELKGEAQEAGEGEAKTRVVEDFLEKTDVESDIVGINYVNCSSQTEIMRPIDATYDDTVVGFDEQSGDHHHGLECFRWQGLRKWYWNLDDKLKCEKGVAFVKNQNLIVPCVYTAMGKNSWSRKDTWEYGCMTGNYNQRCFESSLRPLARAYAAKGYHSMREGIVLRGQEGFVEKRHQDGSFTIGFFGFGEFISPRSAGIAATAPLLLSMYSGSALVNDLNRIQGLMLGNVLVRLLGGFVDSCDWSELVLHSLTTFLWTFGGLFVYFHSRIYSTVGILAAAFGASTLLGVSCNDPNRIGKRDTFDGLMMNCVAFMVTMMMDSLFHSERASDLAHKTLDQCWEQIFQSYKAILDTKTTQVIFHRSNARKLLLQARAMNQEASLEPRFWRIPWQHDLFASVCNTTENIVIALATLESAIAEHGRSGNRKFKTFVQLSEKATSTDNYGMFGDETSVILLIKFVCVRKLLKVFIHETVQKFEGFTDEDSTQQFSSEQQAVEEEFIRRTVPYFFGLEDDQAETSMSHDEMAHLSVVFAGFTRTTALLRSVQHTILSSHWQS